MNDIFKANVKAKIEKAMEKEGLNQATTAKCIGIAACYVSLIKNPENWDKVPVAAWVIANKWVNSGQGLMEYSKKHGKVLAGTSEPEGPEEHSPESVFEEIEPTPETVELKIEMGQQEYVEQVEMIPLSYHRKEVDKAIREKEEFRQQVVKAALKIKEITDANRDLTYLLAKRPASTPVAAEQKIRELTAENERLKEIISQQPAFQVPRDVKVNLIVKVKVEVEQ